MSNLGSDLLAAPLPKAEMGTYIRFLSYRKPWTIMDKQTVFKELGQHSGLPVWVRHHIGTGRVLLRGQRLKTVAVGDMRT